MGARAEGVRGGEVGVLLNGLPASLEPASFFPAPGTVGGRARERRGEGAGKRLGGPIT